MSAATVGPGDLSPYAARLALTAIFAEADARIRDAQAPAKGTERERRAAACAELVRFRQIMRTVIDTAAELSEPEVAA